MRLSLGSGVAGTADDLISDIKPKRKEMASDGQSGEARRKKKYTKLYNAIASLVTLCSFSHSLVRFSRALFRTKSFGTLSLTGDKRCE